MNSVLSEQILEDKLSKLNSTQQCIETLSHLCIFHRSKVELVVSTWDKVFHKSDMVLKVPLLYLANDILQNSKRNGNEFVTEFWKVLPSALKELINKGDERGKTAVTRLVGIWEDRKVFGSRAQGLKDVMLGEELPPPLELGKKRSRLVKIVKRDSRSIRTKLSIGGTAEKIVSAFHLVFGERTTEDEVIKKCKSTLHHVKKMEKNVSAALLKVKDPSRKILAKDLEDEENLLKHSIDKLKVVEANRVALVSQLRDALHEQEFELENLRTQMQVASAQVEEASTMRKQLLDENHVFESKPDDTTKKSASAIAAEVADKLLAASSSSQLIMSSVISTFAAQEAKNASLVKPEPVSDPNNNNVFTPAQNKPPQTNPYQQGQVSNSQTLYHSIPNQQQYIQQQQQSGGIMNLYDYSNIPPFGPGPHQQPSYMVSPMVPFTHQMTQQSQQPLAPPGFHPMGPPQQAPGGMVYYTHPYQ